MSQSQAGRSDTMRGCRCGGGPMHVESCPLYGRDQERMPWADSDGTRVPPRDCIRAARDELNKAYSHPGVTDARYAIPFIAAAVDWQRRALEQMADAE